MGFLAPWFFAGVLAAGLPVYLHLLRQHKSTPLPFSSLMFLERRTQSSIKHRRLRYLALLAARLLLLLLVILAFANPFVNRPVTAVSGDPLLLIAIDNSFSMREGGRLEAARRRALDVLASRSGAQRAQVLALGSNVHLLTDAIQDNGELRAAIASVEASDTRGSFGELARTVRSMALTAPAPIELHLITDIQRSGLPAGFNELALPETASLTVHSVSDNDLPNWTVENVVAPPVMWDPKKTRVQATVAGFGTPEAKRTVTLHGAGRVLATTTVDVPANGRATVEFESLDVPYGLNRCEVRIDGADTLPQDDRMLFAVERSDPRRVLLVHEARDTRSPLYFRAALTSAAEAAFQLETLPTDRTGNLDPARYSFVVLADAATLPTSFEQALQRYVRAGGSIFVALGPQSSRRRTVPVLGGSVNEPLYFARTGARFQTVGDADPTHPSLRRAAAWTGVKFYQAARIDVGEDYRVIARLSDQTPLLLERTMGEGRALLLTSGLENLTNDFPLNPVFVPFVERTAWYLAGLEDRTGSVPVNTFVQLRAARERNVSVEIMDPDGKRALTLEESANLPAYQVAREGYFEVRRSNGRNELVAVNADRRESDLTRIPDETLALWKNTGQGAVEAAVQTDTQQRPVSLWWYAMLALLALVAFESWLAGRHMNVEQEA